MPRRAPIRAALSRSACRARIGHAAVLGALLALATTVVVVPAGASAAGFRASTNTHGPTAPPIGTPPPADTPAPAATTTATPTPHPTATAPIPAPPGPSATHTPSPAHTPSSGGTPTAPATPPAAGAVNSTSLTGRVTDQATGAPLAGITVYIYTQAGGYGTAIPVTTTDDDGSFTFYSLDVRRYTLQFVGSGYRSEWFGGHDKQSAAASFAVALGESVTGKDASLLPIDSISGTVSSGPANDAIAGAVVSAFGTDGTRHGSATTTADGGYAIVGLTPGRYTLRFAPPRGSTLVPEWWQDTNHQSAAAAVTLPAGTAVVGRNAELAAGATVTGRITATTSSAAVQGAWVYVYAAGGPNVAPRGSIASARTNVNGEYTITGLAAGRYTLQFSGGSANGSAGYVREWWGNKSSRPAAGAFSVAAGTTFSGADAALVPTASIGGTVYAAGARNVGLNAATVSAIDADGRLARAVTTNGSGEYTLTGLKPGAYTLRFSGPAGTGFGTTWWHDHDDDTGVCTAGLIQVTAGEVVTGKTVELSTAPPNA